MSQAVMMQAAMTMRPPITPPTIAPTGVFAPVADEVPLGALLPVTLLIVVLVIEEAVVLMGIL
jgi:hypothetical protein